MARSRLLKPRLYKASQEGKYFNSYVSPIMTPVTLVMQPCDTTDTHDTGILEMGVPVFVPFSSPVFWGVLHPGAW